MKGLYAITDSRLIPDAQFAERVEAALKGGARLIQYRDKSRDQLRRVQQADQLVQLCKRYAALSIINDDIELAVSSGADGVHLGLEDGSLQMAREILGQEAVIGISCYNSLQRAQQAEAAGASYVAFGRFFSSPTKPDAKPATIELIQQARAVISVPICAIGGINADNGGSLITAGADMLAVISDLFGNDDVGQRAAQVSALFKSQ